MLEMPVGPTAGDNEAPNSGEAEAQGEEAAELTCPHCGAYIPNEKVATGICNTCWDSLPSELEDCYGPR